MHPQHLTVFRISDDFDKPLAAVQDKRLAVCSHGEASHPVIQPPLLRLRLGKSDRSGLRLDIHADRVGFFVILRLDAHNVLGGDLAHHRGSMGKLCIVCHAVAHSVYAGDARLHAAVDNDPSSVVPEASGLQSKRLGIRPAADGNKDFFCLEADSASISVTADHRSSGLTRLYGLHRTLKMEIYAHLFHAFHAYRRNFLVKHGQHLLQRLHDGDLRSESGVGAGKLQPDHAAADDHHRFRKRFETQCARGVYAAGILLYARNGRHGVS